MFNKYLSATLHSNGEKVEFSTPEDAKKLRQNFRANYFPVEDGAKEMGVTSNASTFVELVVDTTGTPLNPKPQCNNFGTCPDCPTPGKTGQVRARYVADTDLDKGIVDTEFFTGEIGTAYTTEQKTIDGYTFKEMGADSAPASGTFQETEQVVTYVYTAG